LKSPTKIVPGGIARLAGDRLAGEMARGAGGPM
jgi:hypothetical protein